MIKLFGLELRPELDNPMYWLHLVLIAFIVNSLYWLYASAGFLPKGFLWSALVLGISLLIADVAAHTLLGLD